MHKRIRHETFAANSKPGDKPIKVVMEDVPPEFIEQERCLNLLRAYRKGDIADARTDELFDALMNVLDIAPDDEDEPTHGIIKTIRSALTFKFIRRRENGKPIAGHGRPGSDKQGVGDGGRPRT